MPLVAERALTVSWNQSWGYFLKLTCRKADKWPCHNGTVHRTTYHSYQSTSAQPQPLAPSPIMRASSDQAARPPGSFPPARQGRAPAALGVQGSDELGHRCVHYWVTASFFTDPLVSLGRWVTDSLPWLALQCPVQPTPALFSPRQPCPQQWTLSMHMRLAPSSWTFWNLPKKKKKKHLDTFLPKEIPNRVQTKSMAQSVTAAASIY